MTEDHWCLLIFEEQFGIYFIYYINNILTYTKALPQILEENPSKNPSIMGRDSYNAVSLHKEIPTSNKIQPNRETRDIDITQYG